MNGAPYGIRTRVAAVRGRCPRPLDEGDIAFANVTQFLLQMQALKADDSRVSNPWLLPL